MNIEISLIVLAFCYAAAATSRHKLKYSLTTVEVVATKDCHLNTRGKYPENRTLVKSAWDEIDAWTAGDFEEHIVRLPDRSFICSYRGRYHAFLATWVDSTRCLQCTCLGAGGIGCCKIELKPVNMPKRCAVHPNPRWSQVPRLASCMAPIVNIRSKKKMCKSRRLRNAFHNTRWVRVPGQKGQYLKAVKRRNGNDVR